MATPPWTMPNRLWSRRRWASRAAPRPGQGALGRQPDVLLGGRQAAADVEGHLNVGPQAFLHPHGDFRGQALKRSVIGGAEGHAVVICPRCQRKDLKSAGIGEQVARPPGETVQAPQRFDHFHPGPQHQVIGVGQDDLRSEQVEIPGVEQAHRAAGPHRHEAGGGEGASRGLHHASPGQTVPGLDVKPGGSQAAPVPFPTIMASPKERKR